MNLLNILLFSVSPPIIIGSIVILLCIIIFRYGRNKKIIVPVVGKNIVYITDEEAKFNQMKVFLSEINQINNQDFISLQKELEIFKSSDITFKYIYPDGDKTKIVDKLPKDFLHSLHLFFDKNNPDLIIIDSDLFGVFGQDIIILIQSSLSKIGIKKRIPILYVTTDMYYNGHDGLHLNRDLDVYTFPSIGERSFNERKKVLAEAIQENLMSVFNPGLTEWLAENL